MITWVVGMMSMGMTTLQGISGSVDTGNIEVQAEVPAPTILDDDEFISAVKWMHTRGLTTYADAKDFRGEDILTREEAAKFFTQFSMNVLLRIIDMTKYCEFDDLEDADPTLRNALLQSCLLHLFHGSNGKFFPQQQLTKAQALTVLIRALEGNQPEDVEPRWHYYHIRAKELGLTKETNEMLLDMPVSRYEIALLLARAADMRTKEQK